MDKKQKPKLLDETRTVLELVLPFIDDAIEYMHKNNGWLPLSDEFIQGLHNLEITDWAKYYLEPEKLKTLSSLCFYDEDELMELSKDPDTAKDKIISNLILELENYNFEAPTTEDIKKFEDDYKQSNDSEKTKITTVVTIVILSFLTNLFQYLCLMVHGKTITKMIAKAKAGDDKALCNAIQIDKTILYLPFVQKRIIKSQFTNDQSFLDSLSYRIKNPILRGKIKFHKLYLTFAILEDHGLLDMPHKDILTLCQDVGVYGKEYGNEDIGYLGKRLAEYRKKTNMHSKYF